MAGRPSRGLAPILLRKRSTSARAKALGSNTGHATIIPGHSAGPEEFGTLGVEGFLVVDESTGFPLPPVRRLDHG